jgi:hypothetical protein
LADVSKFSGRSVPPALSTTRANIHNKSPSPMAPVAPHISAKAMSMGKRSTRLKRGESMIRSVERGSRPTLEGKQVEGSRDCDDKKQNEGGRYKEAERDARKTLTTTCHSIDRSECGKSRQRDVALFQWLPNDCSCQFSASREFAITAS